MKIIAFAASNSSKSINKQLLTYATGLIADGEVEIVDLNDYELPLFSQDREEELGQPELAKQFLRKIGQSDGVVIAFAEHNGTYTVAYKNIFDWASRINPKVYQNKSMVLLSTSPGGGGAGSVLSQAVNSMPYFDGQVLESLSIPNFHENFDVESGRLTNEALDVQLRNTMQSFSPAHVELNAVARSS